MWRRYCRGGAAGAALVAVVGRLMTERPLQEAGYSRGKAVGGAT